MFFVLGCGVVALFVKQLLFPDASKKEFILAIIQSFWLSTSLLYLSRYTKIEDTKFSLFYDTANIWIKSLSIIILILIFSTMAELVEMIVLFAL